MSQPLLAPVAADLYQALLPLAYADEENGWPLAYLCDAVGAMVQPIDDIVRDTPEGPGWSVLLDIEACPAAALPWLGQFVGVRVDTTLSVDAQRDQIRAEEGMRRGRPASIISAAKRHLTGTKSVVLRERDTSAYHFTVGTLISETPDPTQTLADILSVKPAGLVAAHELLAGQTYQDLYENFATYQDVFTTYATYEGVIEDAPGT